MIDRNILAELYGDYELLFLDPPQVYDKCIVGVADRCGMEPAVVYDAQCVIEAAAKDIGDYDEAVEHYEYNIHGSYLGPATPLFLVKHE